MSDSAPAPHGAQRLDRATSLQPRRTVGREPVIAQLLQAAREGRHVWLQGEAGVGKSRVVSDLLLRTAAIRVSCRPSDGLRRYSLIKRLIGPVEHTSGRESGAEMMALLAGDAALVGTGRQSTDLARVSARTVKVLQDLRRDGVLLCIAEDVHFVDGASAGVLCALFDLLCGRQPGEKTDPWAALPAMLITAKPEQANAAFTQVRLAAERGRRFQFIELLPLDLVDTLALLQQLDVPWLEPQQSAQRMHELSGGNPFGLLDVVHEVCAMPRPAPFAVQMPDMVTMLARRIDAASEPAAQLSALMAIAESDFDACMPQRLLNLDPVQTASAWHELMRMGILDTSGFAHDLARLAALQRLPAPQAKLLHDGVAGFLLDHGGSPRSITEHLLLGWDPRQALAHVQPAAWELYVDCRIEEAIQLLERTLDAQPGGASMNATFDILWACAWYSQFSGGGWAAAVSACRPVAVGPAQTLKLAAVHAFLLLQDHQHAECLEVIEHVQDGAGTNSRAALAVAACRALALAQAERVTEAGAAYAVCAARSSHDTTEINNRFERQVLDRIRTWSMFATSSSLGRLRLAEAHLHEVGQLECPGAQRRLQRQLALLVLHAAAGRFPRSMELLARGADIMCAPRSAFLQDWIILTLSHATTWGDLASARRALTKAPGEPAGPRMYARALFSMQLADALGDEHQVRRLHEGLLPYVDADPDARACQHHFHGFAVLRMIAQGDPEARAAAALIEPSGELSEAPLRQLWPALLACRFRDAEDALSRASHVLEFAASGGVEGLQGGALVEVAWALIRLGRFEQAVARLDAALEISAHACPPVITRADHAARMHAAMITCGHPAADALRSTWRAWRDAIEGQLAPESREAFCRRHAWVGPWRDRRRRPRESPA